MHVFYHTGKPCNLRSGMSLVVVGSHWFSNEVLWNPGAPQDISETAKCRGVGSGHGAHLPDINTVSGVLEQRYP